MWFPFLWEMRLEKIKSNSSDVFHGAGCYPALGHLYINYDSYGYMLFASEFATVKKSYISPEPWRF
jgi:hypothetical protein